MSVLLVPPGRRPLFPEPECMHPGPHGLVALGGDLGRDAILEAYGKGVFPWEAGPPIPWFSPDPRSILVPRAFRASASLRKLDRQARLEVSIDSDFLGVILACASTPRKRQHGTWITRPIIQAYTLLHQEGLAHSVEVWESGDLVGGLYGVALGRAFFGESMFSRRPNASKVALYALCRRLHRAGFHFVDCQQDTAHLRRMGAVAVPRLRYLRLLEHALSYPERWDAVVES